MKKLLLTCVAFILGLTANATTSDISVLRIDSLSVLGNMLAMMNQQMEMQIYNDSKTNDYEARWYLLRCTGNSCDVVMDTLVSIKARDRFLLLTNIRLPEGCCNLTMATDKNGELPIISNMITIKPLRKLNIQTDLNIQMLSTENGQNVLNGSSLKGSVRLFSFDEYEGCREAGDAEDGVWLWLEEAESKQQIAAKQLAGRLGLYQEKTFQLDLKANLRNGVAYVLRVGYMSPEGMVELTSQTFTARLNEITYWTVNEQVLPLTVREDDVLQVPVEAVAVDLRGKGDSYANLKMDVSNANPNCLYYLDKAATMPVGLNENYNVICGGEADYIQVVEEHDYFCPLAFQTKYISYLMKPSYNSANNEWSSRGYSETLVLPFDVNYACIYDVNGVQETLHADMLKVLRYEGNQGDSLTVSAIRNFNQMKAYTPYILGVYVGSRLLFSAENTLVPMTREAIALGRSINFVGTTIAQELAETAYIYDASDGCFRRGNKRVAPFHAYMTIENGIPVSEEGEKDDEGYFVSLWFDADSWGKKGLPGGEQSTTIHHITISSPKVQTLYSLTGQRMSKPKSGLYIVGGKKRLGK